jgi:hypothetical protein
VSHAHPGVSEPEGCKQDQAAAEGSFFTEGIPYQSVIEINSNSRDQHVNKPAEPIMKSKRNRKKIDEVVKQGESTSDDTREIARIVSGWVKDVVTSFIEISGNHQYMSLPPLRIRL